MSSGSTLSYVDFIRVLGLRAMAKHHFGRTSTALVERVWPFLGRSVNVIFVPQDAATLAFALRRAELLEAKAEERIKHLNQIHYDEQTSTTLREVLERWGFEPSARRTLFISGLSLSYGCDNRHDLMIQLGEQILEGKWYNRGQGVAQMCFLAEASAEYEAFIETCLGIHGSSAHDWNLHKNFAGSSQNGDLSELLIFRGHIAGSSYYPSSGAHAANLGKIILWTDEEACARAVASIQREMVVTIQVSPGEYSLHSCLEVRPPFRITGGGACPSDVTLKSIVPSAMIKTANRRIGHHGSHCGHEFGIQAVTRLNGIVEIDNLSFAIHPTQRRGSASRKRHAIDAMDDLTHGMKNLSLINDSATGAFTGIVVSLPTYLHHCSMQGGNIGVLVSNAYAKLDSCRFSHITQAAVHACARNVIIANCNFQDNGIGIFGVKCHGLDVEGNYIIGSVLDVEPTFSGCRQGIRLSESSASLYDNKIQNCDNGIFLESSKACSIRDNDVDHCNGAGLLLHAPWQDVTVKHNALKGNGWGVLCRSVWNEKDQLPNHSSIQQPRQQGHLSIIRNEVAESCIAGILVSGGGLGGNLSLALECNKLNKNRAGITIAGPALIHRISGGPAQYCYNVVVQGNDIINSDKAAVTVERGAAVQVRENNIRGNGRGIAVHDVPWRPCCANIRSNIFENNNGWAVRFHFNEFHGPSSRSKSTECEFMVDHLPEDTRKSLLLSFLLPQVLATNKEGYRKDNLKRMFRKVRLMKVNELMDLVKDRTEFNIFLRRHALSSGSQDPGSQMRAHRLQHGRDSLVCNNTFTASGLQYGRGVWAWRVDTPFQAPYFDGNVNQEGEVVSAHTPRSDVILSTTEPAWAEGLALPPLTVQPPRKRNMSARRQRRGMFASYGYNSDDSFDDFY